MKRWSSTFFSRQNLLRCYKYELIFAALYIFLSIAAVNYLTIPLPFDRKLKQQTTAFEGLPTIIQLFDANRHTLVKRCGWFFFTFFLIHQRKKLLQPIRGKDIFSRSQVDIRVQTSKLLKVREWLVVLRFSFESFRKWWDKAGLLLTLNCKFIFKCANEVTF